MTYEVFTLKYRPRAFDDVVGQEAVAATVKACGPDESRCQRVFALR